MGPLIWSSSGPTWEASPLLVVVSVAATMVLVAASTARWSFRQVPRDAPFYTMTQDRQQTEIGVAVLVLNRMLDLGRPDSVRVV